MLGNLARSVLRRGGGSNIAFLSDILTFFANLFIVVKMFSRKKGDYHDLC